MIANFIHHIELDKVPVYRDEDVHIIHVEFTYTYHQQFIYWYKKITIRVKFYLNSDCYFNVLTDSFVPISSRQIIDRFIIISLDIFLYGCYYRINNVLPVISHSSEQTLLQAKDQV